MSFCLLLFSSFPVYAAQIEPLEGEAVITSDNLNVRSGPSTDYEILGTLDKDQVVEVTGIVEPDWFVIEYSGNQGYIHGDYLVFIPTETAKEEEETAPLLSMKTYLVLGLSVVIFVVIGLIIYTAVSLRRSKEEEDIPLTDHGDTNMHLGEVTYDTYRLDIDPSFFETTTLVPQPESVFESESNEEESDEVSPASEKENKGIEDTGIENTASAADTESTADIRVIDSKLEQATAQLAALQKEVEELKKQKQED